MLISWLHFMALLLLSGLLLRWLETTFPERTWAKALMYLY